MASARSLLPMFGVNKRHFPVAMSRKRSAIPRLSLILAKTIVPFSHVAAPRFSKEEGRYKTRIVELHRPTQRPSESYAYTALSLEDSKIRVLELLGGAGTDIHCKMHIVDLEGTNALVIEGKRRSYDALSYTWQTQTRTKVIICNGKALPVTESVYEALLTLRRASASRLLWIDQICINQANMQERSDQVRLMRFTYNRANLVIAWLGKEDEYTKAAFRLIGTIITKHVSPDISLMAEPEAIWDDQVMDDMNLPRFPSFEWEALAKMFERSYFRRIWVVQEVVVASKTVVRCGSLTISWEYIEYVARSLLSTGWVRALKRSYGTNVIPNFVQTISNIKSSFSELKGGQGIPLSLLLSAARSFGSTDPRDKVIALVGLASHRSLGSAATSMLDYSRSIEDLYIDVTGQLIQRERSLNLLSSVEDISQRTFMDLPSWVPNYSIWQRHTILGSSIRVAHLNYHAAGKTPVSISWLPGSHILIVEGFIQDVIQTVSLNSLDRQLEDMDVVLQWLQLAEPLIRRGLLAIESFWRTLIGDQGRHIFPAPEQYGTHFENYLSHAKARSQGYPGTQSPNGGKAGDSCYHPNSLVYQAALGYVAPHRKFFTTANGTIGLGPRSMQPGDTVCILSGGRVPYVLRGEEGHYRLVGECYVHGIMEGQAIERKRCFKPLHLH